MTIPIRMLNEIQYCERLYYLMHVHKLFEESKDTIEGTAQHQKAENRRRKGDIAPQELWDEAPMSLELGDETLGLVGKLDTVTLEDGNWVPIESKHSSAPDSEKPFVIQQYKLDGNAWPNDQIQLCAQGLLLRANGYPSEFGFLYYRGNKKKVKIQFSEDLVAATLQCIERAKQLEKSEIPTPLRDSNKCFRCSLNYVCLPDETNYLKGISSNIRRIVPDRADGGILYVSEAGAKLGKEAESIKIISRDGNMIDQVPIKDVVQISLIGNVQVSTQLLHTLLIGGVPVSYFSTHGKLIGMSSPYQTKNIQLRKHQFVKFQHTDYALRIARWVIHAKIANQRTILRRNGQIEEKVLKELLELRNLALEASSIDSLRGLEGRAGRLYIQSFSTMLKESTWDGEKIMNGRNRRPPKDPVNALLSLGYTLLTRDVQAACANVGLDPMFGFFHSIEPGRPALALDLMEPFRPLIVDSVVLRVLNTKELKENDFYWGEDNCLLKKAGRQAFFASYERRMGEMVTHPLFQYKISYRRMLELEARFLARYLEGDIPEYRPLMTR